ncbi:MAG: hypothetical protein ACFFCP_11240 [Promethearchaeota archaeon]
MSNFIRPYEDFSIIQCMELRDMTSEDNRLDEVEKRFLKKYWRMMVLIAALAVLAVVAATYVLTWFVATAQATGFVPAVLGQWSIGHVFAFIIHLIFWELLFVGSWVLIAIAVIMIRWYRNLPPEDRERKPKRGRREESDAFGFLVMITWLIVVWLDGRWNLAFESWTFNNWVYSFLAALGWDLLIFGIPIALGLLWWLRKEISTEPQAV